MGANDLFPAAEAMLAEVTAGPPGVECMAICAPPSWATGVDFKACRIQVASCARAYGPLFSHCCFFSANAAVIASGAARFVMMKMTLRFPGRGGWPGEDNRVGRFPFHGQQPNGPPFPPHPEDSASLPMPDMPQVLAATLYSTTSA